MNFLKRLPWRSAVRAQPPVEPNVFRPLSPVVGATFTAIELMPETAARMQEDQAFAEALSYFTDYPPRSLMSDHSRAVLFWLVRALRPQAVAEIGTLYAGTTEVLARALWENGGGIVHTADPYGGDRCPAIIAQWPAELQRHARFRPLSSMDFFARLVLESVTLDMVLVDGNHDYEYAMFDLQMAARLLRPGGVIVMDNSEQTGPYSAARVFLEANPSWGEIGSALAAYDPFKPFDRTRASLPFTSFIVLQAPSHVPIGAGPHSWGQRWIDLPRLNGLQLDIVAPCKGTLFYQVTLRGFANKNRWVKEERLDGALELAVDRKDARVEHRFPRAMAVTVPPEYDDALYTLEFDLSWQADKGSPPLALTRLPTPICD
jgi:predicted O-methyltransferase YrrM